MENKIYKITLACRWSNITETEIFVKNKPSMKEIFDCFMCVQKKYIEYGITEGGKEFEEYFNDLIKKFEESNYTDEEIFNEWGYLFRFEYSCKEISIVKTLADYVNGKGLDNV